MYCGDFEAFTRKKYPSLVNEPHKVRPLNTCDELSLLNVPI
jgi:hypothetical protein